MILVGDDGAGDQDGAAVLGHMVGRDGAELRAAKAGQRQQGAQLAGLSVDGLAEQRDLLVGKPRLIGDGDLRHLYLGRGNIIGAQDSAHKTPRIVEGLGGAELLFLVDHGLPVGKGLDVHIHLGLEAVAADDAIAAAGGGRKEIVGLVDVLINGITEGQLVTCLFLLLDEAGADGTGLGYALGSGVLCDGLAFCAKLDAPLAAGGLFRFGNADLVLLLGRSALTDAAPITKVRPFGDILMTAFTFHIIISVCDQPNDKGNGNKAKSGAEISNGSSILSVHTIKQRLLLQDLTLIVTLLLNKGTR